MDNIIDLSEYRKKKEQQNEIRFNEPKDIDLKDSQSLKKARQEHNERVIQSYKIQRNRTGSTPPPPPTDRTTP